MIQDWGYNYLYLRHEGVITRVNLRNHEYRDVTHSPVEEFDSTSSEELNDVIGKPNEIWMCGASNRSIELGPEDSERTRREQELLYVPLPFPEHLIDPQEWIHVLATLTTCALPKPTKFCDEDGYDIVPIWMIGAVVRNEPSPEEFYEAKEDIFGGDSVSVTDIISSDYGTADSEHRDDVLDGTEGYDSEDFVVPKEELEKIRLLLKGREEIALELPSEKPKRKFCKSHRKFRKQAIREKRKLELTQHYDPDANHFKLPEIPPEFQGKNEFPILCRG